MHKRILVTGGMGFIGQHLIRKLLASDKEISSITIVDNLCNSDLGEVGDLLLHKKISYHFQSVAEWNPSSPEKFDEIYHLASPVGPAGVLDYAGRMCPMIIQDTYKLAQMALDHGASFIDLSSSEVYGKDPGNIPQREDIDKIVPSKITIRLEYGVAKLASEVFLLNLARTSDLKVNIIRPFNIVGPSQKGEVGFVLPRFISAALKNLPLTIFGDGLQRRTFTSVFDIVDGLISIMNSEVSGEIFNIGNPENECSILDLARLVIRLSDSKSLLDFVDPKEIYGEFYEEAWNKIPDISKISDLIGWSPKESLEEIILECIQHLRVDNYGKI
jgi:nucleoside-diphosphate-sugar epimerase